MKFMDKIWSTACATTMLLVFAPVGSRAEGSMSTPILVELFTSEGCSTCPAADNLLHNLSQNRLLVNGHRVITLSEHVDYWDYLGWRDPFARPVFTARQRDYCAHFDAGSCYTPQIVIDGNIGFVGSDGRRLAEGLNQVALIKKSSLRVKTVKNGSEWIATLSYLPLRTAHGQAELYVAVVSQANESRVSAGENSGQVLKHSDVALELNKLAVFDCSQPFNKMVTIKTQPEWQHKKIYLTAFVQMQENKKVIAVASEI